MTGMGLPTRLESKPPSPAMATNTKAPATPPATAPTRAGAVLLDLNHLQVFDRASRGSRVHVVEEESRVGMALPQLGGVLPAHVAKDVARSRGLDDRDVGPVDQLVERLGRLGVARISHDLAVHVDSI